MKRIIRLAMRRTRMGFTLIETIVTVGLLAVIAAFVIPTVIQKAGSGDPVKVQNDLNAVQTAVATFATDSKAGFPHQISSLTSKPLADVDRLIDSTAITANQVAMWNGPYLGATVSPLAADSVPTGYAAFIMNVLERYDAVGNVPEHNTAGQDSAGFSPNSTLFVGVQLHGLTLAQAKSLNAIIDGGSDSTRTGNGASTGRFRYSAPDGGVVKAFYLAAPIAK
jgi:type II secretory pathway pseudopilin PulG